MKDKIVMFYKSFDDDRKVLFWGILLSFIITIIFLVKLCFNGYWIWGNDIKMDATGQFGDFIGGVVGTIFSGLGFYFLYITLVEQRKSINSQNNAILNQQRAFEKERFEAKYYDLIKLYRENVIEQNYTKFGKKDFETANGRKVFRIIHKEFEECYTEVKRYCKISNQYDFILEKHNIYLNEIKTKNRIRVNNFEFAIIDIAFCILYFGVAVESETYLTNRFSKKYKNEFYYRLIKFMQLKPRKENIDEYNAWKTFRNTNTLIIRPIFDIIYLNRRDKNFIFLIDDINIFKNYDLEKYYNGHQHRLGHYYRHLFQAFKYLENQKELGENEKYFYGKTFRAQLSTFEQSLLFVNSVSSLGIKWDIDCEKNEEGKLLKLISIYHLVKNVPGRKLLDITYRSYYPKVKFEFLD